MHTIYLAGPLFCEAERDWHRNTKQQLLTWAEQQQQALKIIWPYELISEQEIATLGDQARMEIFRRCKNNLQQADILIALLDGTQVDDGTAWEIGYFFHARHAQQRIIGIRTDFRRAGESKHAVVNAMIEMACDQIVFSRTDLLAAVQAHCSTAT